MVKINGNEIRKGNVIEHKNGLWIAVKTSHVKPGKGGAFAQVELKNIRTGRVSPDILKTIVVDSYGSKTPLTQLSNINNLDNMTLNVNVWDSSLIKIIEKTIIDLSLIHI